MNKTKISADSKKSAAKNNVTNIKTSDSKQKRAKSPKKQIKLKQEKYQIDMIKKQNFDNFHVKVNITQIKELPVKYVLKCIQGIYKNRFLYITTHAQGEVFGSGDAKTYGLTLQIEGAGLSSKHTRLKFDGFKNFDILDFGSENGTWMNIPKDGVQIKNGQHFSIGPYIVQFTYGQEVNQIQQICIVYHVNYLSDLLIYNGIKNLSQLYAAQYSNFKDYPFNQKDVQKIKRICNQSKKWYQEDKKYTRLNCLFQNQPHKDLQIQIGWESFIFGQNSANLFSPKETLAQVCRGRLIPKEKVFTKIQANKQFALSLHSQLKLGDLMFQLTRFNIGSTENIGGRSVMQDGLLIQQDIGGSQWKLISLFAVFDGHGGPQCMTYFKSHLIQKVRGWTSMLDEAGDLNQMVKVLMNKTFFQLDYEFYQKYPQISLTCGCTAMVMLLIQSKAFVFSVGDCKGYVLKNTDKIFQLGIDHIPSRGDERIRIEGAGGFIQYDRLMGKCTLSRSLGQFEYKNLDDYQNKLKGAPKSFLSCIPDLVTFDLNAQTDDFLLLSTDGIFSSFSIQQISDYIMQKYDKLQLQQSPNKIVSSLVQNCKVTTKQCDNMAVILIIIRKGIVGTKKVW